MLRIERIFFSCHRKLHVYIINMHNGNKSNKKKNKNKKRQKHRSIERKSNESLIFISTILFLHFSMHFICWIVDVDFAVVVVVVIVMSCSIIWRELFFCFHICICICIFDCYAIEYVIYQMRLFHGCFIFYVVTKKIITNTPKWYPEDLLLYDSHPYRKLTHLYM